MTTRRQRTPATEQAVTRITLTKKPALFWKFEVAGQILEVMSPTEKLTVDELCRRVHRRTQGGVKPSTSDIYETLDWMEEEGYIKTVGGQ